MKSFKVCKVLPGVGPKRLEPLAELALRQSMTVNALHFDMKIFQIRDVNTIMDQRKSR